MKTYKFEITTTSKDCFKKSITELAVMIKTNEIDLETFATEQKEK